MVSIVWRVMTTVLECFGTRSACSHGVTAKNEEIVVTSGLSFSPDNTKLLFDRCVTGKKCALGVYDLSAGRLFEYRSPPSERRSMAQYSDDGQRIVFVRTPIKEGGCTHTITNGCKLRR